MWDKIQNPPLKPHGHAPPRRFYDPMWKDISLNTEFVVWQNTDRINFPPEVGGLMYRPQDHNKVVEHRQDRFSPGRLGIEAQTSSLQ